MLVQVSDSIYSNVALMAGCTPLYVSPSLHVHPTADGVKLSPSAFPPSRTIVVTQPAPAPAPIAKEPVVVVATVPWIVFGAGAGVALGVVTLGALAFAIRRRRRDMQPRADRLT